VGSYLGDIDPSGSDEGDCIVDWKLELVLDPVSDVDRVKTFYVEKAGFNLNVDHRGGGL
jgi:hypothetical protein